MEGSFGIRNINRREIGAAATGEEARKAEEALKIEQSQEAVRASLKEKGEKAYQEAEIIKAETGIETPMQKAVREAQERKARIEALTKDIQERDDRDMDSIRDNINKMAA